MTSRATTAAGAPAGEDLLWFLAEGTAGAVGEAFFQCLAEHVALALGADVAFVAEVAPEDRGRARFLACWQQGRFADPIEYCMAGTPCAHVGEDEVVAFHDGIQERFPDDEMLVELGVNSYLGVALRGSSGAHLGHLGVLAASPLDAGADNLAVLRIFAARAAAELERRRHERTLREREAAHRALAAEQAALRHVAMLVAVEAPQQEVWDCVVTEVGGLLDADTASLVRRDGDQGVIVAGWSASPAHRVRMGHTFDVDSSIATRKALLEGRPSRADEEALAAGDVALRALGLRSAVAAPITVAGRVWGAIRAARTGADPLPAGAEQRLGDFAEIVAQAIANAEAREELTASRARIVEASDAARRRIERNLHDGAQQRLVSLALNVRLAQKTLGGAPGAEPILGRLAEELAAALTELRELARGIHPATLTEHGLGPALESLAARSPVPVEFTHAPTTRLPAPVEATAYYVVAEALTNVAKYARAGHVSVSVQALPTELVIEVRDDGVGGASIDGGSGLRGLADRVEAVRGRLRVESPPGRGTTVAAAIPVSGGPASG